MELKYVLYITINLCNGKFYIGVHRTNPEVFDGYIGNGIYGQSYAKSDKKGLHAAVRKYGYENFKRTILAIFPDTKEGYDSAYNLEATLINEYSIKSKSLYNLALGGKGSSQMEEKKRVYMFDIKGNYLRSYSSAMDAVIDLNCENLTSSQHAIRNNCLGQAPTALGYFWSYRKQFEDLNKTKVKVAQYTISGKFLRYWDSISEAERELNSPTIYQAIVKKGSAVNYQWRYYNGDNSDITPLINVSTKNKTIPILMISKETNNLTEYNCVNDCIKSNPDLNASQINRVLNKVIKSHKGFIFRYKDEEIV